MGTIQDDINNLQGNNNSEAINTLTNSLNEIKTKFDSIYTILHVPESLNSIYRSKDLLNHRVLEKSNLDQFIKDHGISTGKFNDIYVGDTFAISDKTLNIQGMFPIFIVAGFNCFYSRYGDIKNHIVCIPQYPVEVAAMNSTGNTNGGFANSNMFKTILPAINTKLTNFFGSHLLSTTESLSTAATNGVVTSFSNYTCKAVLMSDQEVHGYNVLPQNKDYGSYSKQLPLFNLCPKLKSSYSKCWLRNIANPQSFMIISDDPFITNWNIASDTSGTVIPRFLIG